MSPLTPEIRELFRGLSDLGRRAVAEYAPIVDSIVRNRSTDVRHIEHTLDGMLGFCFDSEMLPSTESFAAMTTSSTRPPPSVTWTLTASCGIPSRRSNDECEIRPGDFHRMIAEVVRS